MPLEPKSFYEDNKSARQNFEDRAIKYAELTLPYLIRDSGETGAEPLPDRYGQSFGGRAVNSLKAKIGMALLPPATPSFKLVADADALDEIGRGIDEDETDNTADDAREAFFKGLSRSTARINTAMDAQKYRGITFRIIAQLIVVGSVIIEKIKDKGVRFHPLQSFTVKLNQTGDATVMCIEEKLTTKPTDAGFSALDDKEEYKLYTLLELVEGKWIMSQQIDDIIITEMATYTEDKVPFQYVGWNHMVGDEYHRPFVEDYYEDLKQFSELSNLTTAGSIAAAKTLIFVDSRSGRTRPRDVSQSKNLDVMTGRAEDVSAFQLGKNYDFQVPMQKEAELKRELASAFLMNESATRDAERVTAAEVQFMAQELETTTLAGVYSELSDKIVSRYITWTMNEEGISFKELKVKLVVGLDALGRSSETRALDGFVQTIGAIGASNRLKADELTQRYASLYNVDTSGLLKTNEELDKEMKAQQAQMQQQIAQQEGAKTAGAGAGQAIADAAQQEIQS